MTKNKCVRFKPQAKSALMMPSKYSGFRGISFGTKKLAQKFIKKIRKQGIYTEFRIKKIKC